ncbi:hypothetical protein K443DRAFT_319705 [Laccaria amethystina LaAM-08-1]|uniref:Uncharacterized protein n=1 Tax=Laccaria amethystina LaAM-08-1 TaxID=1095629 RepID=A0A0C9X1P5_9AGAR|nr:hypothetical protein K443DRAFT_319705 [Laccaria amethystina LaAM-08-1]
MTSGRCNSWTRYKCQQGFQQSVTYDSTRSRFLVCQKPFFSDKNALSNASESW